MDVLALRILDCKGGGFDERGVVESIVEAWQNLAIVDIVQNGSDGAITSRYGE